MERFKSTHIEFENQVQRIEDLISRARFYAQTNRPYSLEIILHLQDHAHQLDDAALFTVCRELMYAVQSPSPYSAKRNQRFASDENNRPRMAEPLAEELSYDDSLDDIFDERVRGQKVL